MSSAPAVEKPAASDQAGVPRRSWRLVWAIIAALVLPWGIGVPFAIWDWQTWKTYRAVRLRFTPEHFRNDWTDSTAEGMFKLPYGLSDPFIFRPLVRWQGRIVTSRYDQLLPEHQLMAIEESAGTVEQIATLEYPPFDMLVDPREDRPLLWLISRYDVTCLDAKGAMVSRVKASPPGDVWSNVFLFEGKLAIAGQVGNAWRLHVWNGQEWSHRGWLNVRGRMPSKVTGLLDPFPNHLLIPTPLSISDDEPPVSAAMAENESPPLASARLESFRRKPERSQLTKYRVFNTEFAGVEQLRIWTLNGLTHFVWWDGIELQHRIGSVQVLDKPLPSYLPLEQSDADWQPLDTNVGIPWGLIERGGQATLVGCGLNFVDFDRNRLRLFPLPDQLMSEAHSLTNDPVVLGFLAEQSGESWELRCLGMIDGTKDETNPYIPLQLHRQVIPPMGPLPPSEVVALIPETDVSRLPLSPLVLSFFRIGWWPLSAIAMSSILLATLAGNRCSLAAPLAEITQTPATIWRRIWARVIDLGLMLIAVLAAVLAYRWSVGKPPWPSWGPDWPLVALFESVELLPPTAAGDFFHSSGYQIYRLQFLAVSAIITYQVWTAILGVCEGFWSQTPGKWCLGIRVRTSDGSRLSFAAAMIRAAARHLDELCPPVTLAVMIWLGTPLRFGDWLAGTIVVEPVPRSP